MRQIMRRKAASATVSGTHADTAASGLTVPLTVARAAAATRLLTAFIFLWAFGDKTFGWGYATPAGKGWIDGGSPTKGFLSHVAAGPMEEVFHSWAGAAWADWTFMLGLLGIGVALASGVALRVAAAAGTVMMALMWAAEWPLARHLSDRSLSMSTNPLVDYHVLYAALLVTLAAIGAGRVWGLGSVWQDLPLVRRHRWLL
jgi:thiosulfate dehydrogenase [quinone] large subunit